MSQIRSMTLRDRFLCLVWPAYRRRNEAAMRETIRQLVTDPSLPVSIDGHVIPHGYGDKPVVPWMRENGLL
jgi:hypothetical protein